MRVGLVGAGRWGRRYIATLREMRTATLAHLASANPDSAALLPAGCRLSPDWRDLVADPGLDAVIIATPPATHLEIALAAIEHAMPVLVEKPMTLALDEARQLVERARRAQVLVMIGHTHLYSSAFRELKNRGARLGALRGTRSVGGNSGPYRPDASVLWDWGPHDVAMCLDLFGGVPRVVRASRAQSAPLSEGPGEAIEMLLEFSRDACAEIRVSNIEALKRRCFEARYELGTLTYDDLAADKLVLHANGRPHGEPLPLDPTLPLTNLVRAFCRSVAAGGDRGESLALGLRVVEVLAECQAQLDQADARTAVQCR